MSYKIGQPVLWESKGGHGWFEARVADPHQGPMLTDVSSWAAHASKVNRRTKFYPARVWIKAKTGPLTIKLIHTEPKYLREVPPCGACQENPAEHGDYLCEQCRA
jgi:hypothetical protein